MDPLEHALRCLMIAQWLSIGAIILVWSGMMIYLGGALEARRKRKENEKKS